MCSQFQSIIYAPNYFSFNFKVDQAKKVLENTYLKSNLYKKEKSSVFST